MQILRNKLDNINISKNGLAIALGTFDGVHKGHVELLNKLNEIAADNNLNTLVYTFDNQPLNVLLGDDRIKFIMTLKEREEAISNLPIDYLFIKHFDKKYASISCTDFIKHLISFPCLKHVVVGFNFTFGRNAEGNSLILKDLLKKAGVDVTVISPVIDDDTPISSTKIRELISKGDLDNANRLLGKYYSIESIVVPGKQIGNTLGFPTANINYNTQKVLPKTGVYITTTTVDGRDFPSITNVGYNPTVTTNNKDIKIETYLLDYNDSLYGEEIKVNFIKKIRNERTFESVIQLKDQIAKDVLTARNYFGLSVN